MNNYIIGLLDRFCMLLHIGFVQGLNNYVFVKYISDFHEHYLKKVVPCCCFCKNIFNMVSFVFFSLTVVAG